MNEAGEALFDIHNLFADLLYPKFKFPETSNQIVIAWTHQSGEHRIRYWEQYGNPVLARNLTFDFELLVNNLTIPDFAKREDKLGRMVISIYQS